MTETELVELGFKKIVIADAESGNGFDYYYYNMILTENLHLTSSDNEATLDNNWRVINFDWPAIDNLDKEMIIKLKEIFKHED
jgi:hypothetical protein